MSASNKMMTSATAAAMLGMMMMMTMMMAASPVQATIAVTYPVASTVCHGGQTCGPFAWTIDDSVLPLGDAFGRSSVGLYTGSVQQQSLFLDLGEIRDPTAVSELRPVNVDADLGPSGDFYFLRFESLDAVDPTTGFPLQAFSAKFTLAGMTGQLTPEASAQINGVILATTSTRAPRTTAPASSSSSSSSSSRGEATSTAAGPIRAAAAVSASANSSPRNATASGSADTGAAIPSFDRRWSLAGITGITGGALAALLAL